MNEKILAFIWQNRLFDSNGLKTTHGLNLDIVKTGFLNAMSGPDITDAQVRIGNILWVGNVEFHTKSSHWKLHGHDNDSAYDNVILHVVYEDDCPLIDKYGNKVPTFIINCDDSLIESYNTLIKEKDSSRCISGIFNFKMLSSSLFIKRLTVERLETKSKVITETLKHNNYDWNETFWQFLSRGFGFGKNGLPFELMAKSLPINLIQKNLSSFTSVLALMFGQSGFLEDNHYKGTDKEQLLSEYLYQQKKYSLTPINVAAWKFSGIRPQNSPFVRMRQLAALVSQTYSLMSVMLDCTDLDAMIKIFEITKNSEIPSLSEDARQLLIVNTVCPFLVSYSKYLGDEHYAEFAVELLENLPYEKNSIVRDKIKAGFSVNSAFDSQAILQLDSCYCKQERCIDCQIGRYYLYSRYVNK